MNNINICIAEIYKYVSVCYPTGYGKSIIYQLCGRVLSEIKNHVTIVITPLNVIQEDQMRSLLTRGISSCRIGVTGQTAHFVSEKEEVFTR